MQYYKLIKNNYTAKYSLDITDADETDTVLIQSFIKDMTNNTINEIPVNTITAGDYMVCKRNINSSIIIVIYRREPSKIEYITDSDNKEYFKDLCK